MEDNYRLLANAIIKQAVKDYRKAVEHDDRGSKREVLRFFRSNWFKDLSGINGNFLINELKEEEKVGKDLEE